MQKTLLLVVADSSRVRFFTSVNGHGNFREHDDMTHPAARVHTQQLTTDFPGSGFSPGGSRHGFSNRVSVKEHERMVFAKEVAEYVEQARINGEFSEMVLIASPAFLGELRSALSPGAAALIKKTVGKNLVTRKIDHIIAQIEDD